MSPRSGRPKVEKPKQNDVKVRLDDETKERLDRYCMTHATTRAEAIRRGVHLLLAQEK